MTESTQHLKENQRKATHKCRHLRWHLCGWTEKPDDHTCPDPPPNTNTDPPFWKAIDPITDQAFVITYRCDNCGKIDSMIVDEQKHVLSSTFKSKRPPIPSDVNQRPTGLP